ncbi:MAG: hypothetical protein HY204_02530 [Nitrospirae bacterium]|nr:hypothetical protein [Nitrospirota bacterium]
MKMFRLGQFAIFLLTATVGVSCAGGGGGSTTAGGGVGGTGVSVGKITAFGSVFVNRVEFNTTGATITVNGDPTATQTDLGIGMVVTVKGTINGNGTTGTASSIDYNNNLEGPIDSINLLASFLVVLGQTVAVDSSTVFENATFGSLAKGDIVEISGFVGSDGTIVATRIERTPPGTHVELTGTISNTPVSNTFQIGSQVVDYSGAVLENVPPSGLALGMLVEVKGTLDASGVLIATQIGVVNNALGAAEGDLLEIEGLVNQFTNASDFEVNGQRVQTNSQTLFENGAPANIQANVLLEVEGTLDANGILIAREISFE